VYYLRCLAVGVPSHCTSRWYVDGGNPQPGVWRSGGVPRAILPHPAANQSAALLSSVWLLRLGATQSVIWSECRGGGRRGGTWMGVIAAGGGRGLVQYQE
jgi:hypothetical protein